ncbi:MAG: hypothetical protein KGJ88_04365 [Verrucomicrobiota bacterium]|nr:hypothetical protein [Verrucomicrobiota bacterium]
MVKIDDQMSLFCRHCFLQVFAIFYGAVCSVAAPGAAMQAGKPIIFSAPDGTAPTAPAVPSLGPKSSALLDLIEESQPQEGLAPPLPAPTLAATMGPSPADARKAQRQRDEEANWTMLTPAEILHVPTPEKILGIDQEDTGGPLTVEERYYLRMQRQQEGGTNSLTGPGSGFLSSGRDNGLLTGNANMTPNQYGAPGGQPGSAAADNGMQPLFNRGWFAPPDAAQQGNGQQSVSFMRTPMFGPAARRAQPTAQQLADQAQFAKLLAFHPAPAAAPVPANGADGALVQPAGAPFQLQPISNGLMPLTAPTTLTGLAGMRPVAVKAPPPEWKRQPAPWLRRAPQPAAPY